MARIFQALATIAALALIASAILISRGSQERNYKAAKPAPEPVAEAPPPEPPDREPPPRAAPVPVEPEVPEKAEIKDFDSDVSTLDAWLSRCRGRISQFPPGTTEYERIGRTLRALFRTDPSLLQKSARLLVEDRTLEPYTQSLIVEAIARSDDPYLADSALRDLLCHEQSSETLKACVLSGMRAARRISESTLKELIRITDPPNPLAPQAVETLGSLTRRPAPVTDSMRREIIECVLSRHEAFLASENIEGVQSSLKALAHVESPESRSRFDAALRHRNQAVRSAAIRAWSSLEFPDRRRLLMDVLSTEQDATTRIEVIKGLYPAPGERAGAALGDSLIERLLKICRDDRDERVRQAALGFFARHFSHANLPPGRVTDTIRGIVRSDSSAANREYAEWILRERYGTKP